MAKSKVYPDTEGSIYQAWCPMWGFYDVRWAASCTLSDSDSRRYDTDMDVFKQKDLDQKYLCV